MDIEFDVYGDEELQAAFAELAAGVNREVLQRALLKAAAPTVAVAKALAPRGNPPSKKPLHTTIKAVAGLSRRERRRRRSILAGELGLSSGRNLTAAEGKLVDEAGAAVVTITATAPHAILVERGHALVKVKRGLFLTKTTVISHVRAYPFLRPAWDQTRDQALEIFREELRAAIRVAVEKAARRARAA